VVVVVVGVVNGVVITVNKEEGVATFGSNGVGLALGKDENLKKFLKGLKSVGRPPNGLRFEKISPV